MKVFVTGATGFIGSVLVPELLKAGHQVLGLARSDESAKALTDAGAEAHRGSLDDLDSLKRGATAADGVIHLGFVVDFANFAAAAETDRRAIEALGDAVYTGDGNNRWPAVHRLDAAHLFRRVLEQGVAGASYHGVADEGIPMRELMTVIGRHLNLPVASKSPEEAAEYLGGIAFFTALDAPSSSALTQQQLGWHPNQPGLLADLEAGNYFSS